MSPARRRRPPKSVDRTAPDFDLGAVVDDMRTEYVQCRDFGHSWRPFTATLLRGGGYEQTLRCSRCRTRRNRLIGPRGQILSSGYDYADGYVIKGLGRLVGTEKDHLRLLSVRRIAVEDTAEE